MSESFIKIKRHKNTKGELPPLPKKATSGSAGFDLCAFCESFVVIEPQGLVKIPTGISIEIPIGYAGFVFGRSGLGIKNGITLSNSVGVIDSDYRGEIVVGLCNISDESYTISPLERIAQLVIMPVGGFDLIEAEELDDTIRGKNGFGSTGK